VLAEMALAVELAASDVRIEGAPGMHWLAEIEKRAFRDRNSSLGDPAFSGNGEKLFTDPVRVRRLVASINPERATPSADLAQAFPEKPATTHFSVVDGDGMVVAVTTTLNDSFGNARAAIASTASMGTDRTTMSNAPASSTGTCRTPSFPAASEASPRELIATS
jgi:gamma-glutamyltranspeptidase/glutathione hydrolase